MKQLMLLIAACVILTACGKKSDLRTPPGPGETPTQQTD